MDCTKRQGGGFLTEDEGGVLANTESKHCYLSSIGAEESIDCAVHYTTGQAMLQYCTVPYIN